MEINKIYNENCISGLKTLPDKSVQTCVTSPPYYGLRDYGTANWIGGDADCDHIESLNAHGGERSDRNQDGYKKAYKDVCAKCGAVREDEQVGLEETPEAFVQKLVEVFREVKRVLKDDGTLWLNLGDSYSRIGGPQQEQTVRGNKNTVDGFKGSSRGVVGIKPKDLIGIPWMVAFALRADGWYLRQDIIWHKPNPMPESVTDRCTKSHEYIFLLSKSQKYYYDHEAVKEPLKGVAHIPGNKLHKDKISGPNDRGGQSQWETSMDRVWGADGMANKRSVWSVTTKPYKEAHFATYPEKLIEPCIKAGCPEGGVVLDPFMGAGTTALVARKLNRFYIGFELNPEYISIAEKRLFSDLGMFA